MYKKYFKRIFDILLSIIFLFLFWWVFIIIAIFVKIKIGSPVIFKQKRPGLNEKIFVMYKFRTMTNEKDVKGNLLSDKDRLTKFGKFLRSTSLDEIPEFFNILKGDMSLIGPRPLLIKYLNYYKENERKRHEVRPGISGWAQINGRNILTWDKRLAMDIEYIEKMSFLFDLKIIFLTIKKILIKENIVSVEELSFLDLDVERKNDKDNCYKKE